MSVDLRIVAASRRRLEAAVRASTGDAVDQRLERFIDSGARSPKRLDAAFAAAQALRDLEVINADEAAYVLSELCSAYVESTSKGNPLGGKSLTTEAEIDRALKSIRRRDQAVMAALHRERGEVALAEMMLADPDAYGTLCAEGEISLMMDIPEGPPPSVTAAQPDEVAAVSEPILAYFTTEWGKDRYGAWQALLSAIHDAGPVSAIAAAQSIRGLGVISFEESLALVDLMIGSDVDEAAAADRESRRLANAIERIDVQLKQLPPPEGAADPRVAERERLTGLSAHRYNRLQAICLRRYGEHRMANLLIANPKEYERIREEEI